MRASRLIAAVIVASVVSATAEQVSAQGLGDRLKRKAKERIDRKTDQAADKTLDKVEDTVKCAATDSACIEKAKAEGKKVETTGAVQSSGAAGDAATPGEAAPPTAFVNFDFVPGERVLFSEDFTKDNVGDFPRRVEFGKGNMEVAEFRGSRWLRGTTDGHFSIVLPEALPERFTLELEYIGNSSSWPHLTVRFDGKGVEGRESDYVTVHTWAGNSSTSSGGIVDPNGNERAHGELESIAEKPTTVRVMADGRYVKVYVGGTRVANVPNANLGRSNQILVHFDADTERPAYFSNFRIAAGGKKLYDALAESGRVATQGIYFGTGSASLRPESAPTLKEIAAMLKEHSDLSLTIEGHTDNVGNTESNQTLSEQRAAAVKAALVADYGIEGARLTTAGFGATKPVGSNDTPEGRQTNRRVELVKR
jgi:OmpA-OmpF porin, OOP family